MCTACRATCKNTLRAEFAEGKLRKATCAEHSQRSTCGLAQTNLPRTQVRKQCYNNFLREAPAQSTSQELLEKSYTCTEKLHKATAQSNLRCCNLRATSCSAVLPSLLAKLHLRGPKSANYFAQYWNYLILIGGGGGACCLCHGRIGGLTKHDGNMFSVHCPLVLLNMFLGSFRKLPRIFLPNRGTC